MRKLILIAALAALPALALAQTQTPVIGNDTPRDPQAPGTPHAMSRKPDQTSLPHQDPTLRTKDPFEPKADESPQQKVLPDRTP